MNHPSAEVGKLRQEAEYYRELALKRLEEIEWWKKHNWTDQTNKMLQQPQVQSEVQAEWKKKIIFDLEVEFSSKLKAYTQEVSGLREENRELIQKNESLRMQLEKNQPTNHQKEHDLQAEWQHLVNSAIKEETVRRDTYLENEKRLNDLRCEDLKRQIENLRQALARRDQEIKEVDIAYARKLVDLKGLAVKNLEKEYLYPDVTHIGGDERTIEMLSAANRELRSKILELEKKQAGATIDTNLEIARMKG